MNIFGNILLIAQGTDHIQGGVLVMRDVYMYMYMFMCVFMCVWIVQDNVVACPAKQSINQSISKSRPKQKYNQ